jgi:hypothetical protein
MYKKELIIIRLVIDWLDQHSDAIHDGFLPIKVKDQVILEDYVYAIIVPEAYRNKVENIIPANLKNKTYYIVNDCKDVWDWSEKVYSFVEKIYTCTVEKN